MGTCHVLTDDKLFFFNLKFYVMPKKVIITSNEKQEGILNDALNASDNEKLDLFKAIFGGARNKCDVVGVAVGGPATAGRSGASAAYYNTFLLASV